MKDLIRPILAALAFSAASNCEALEFEPISMPTAAYTTSTSRIDLGPIPDLTYNISSILDSTLSIGFTPQVIKTGVGWSWGIWGSPPYTETNNPDVLYCPNPILSMALSVPLRTFGFELQGNSTTVNEFTVQFYDGTNLVGSINRLIDGNGGARLFAATSTTRTFNRIVINNVDGLSGGFAIANLRYSVQPVPEPATWLTGAISAVVAICAIRKRRIQRSGTPQPVSCHA